MTRRSFAKVAIPGVSARRFSVWSFLLFYHFLCTIAQHSQVSQMYQYFPIHDGLLNFEMTGLLSPDQVDLATFTFRLVVNRHRASWACPRLDWFVKAGLHCGDSSLTGWLSLTRSFSLEILIHDSLAGWLDLPRRILRSVPVTTWHISGPGLPPFVFFSPVLSTIICLSNDE